MYKIFVNFQTFLTVYYKKLIFYCFQDSLKMRMVVTWYTLLTLFLL